MRISKPLGRAASLWALLIAIALTTTACSNDSESASENDSGNASEDTSDETFTIQFPHGTPAESLEGKCAQEFADELDARSDGRLKVTITPGGALGAEAELIDNVTQGVFEMTMMSTAAWAGLQERAGVQNLPFVFKDFDQVRTWIDSDDYADMVNEFASENAANVLDGCAGYFRDIAATRALIKPADFEGLKVRVPEDPMYLKTFEALGAEPVPIPYPETYGALQTNLVDAVDAAFDTFNTLGYDDLVEHFSATRHIMTFQVFIINEEFLNSLPDDLQDVIQEVSDDVLTGKWMERSESSAETAIAALEQRGANVHLDVDAAALEEAVASTRDTLAREAGVAEEYERLTAVIGQ